MPKSQPQPQTKKLPIQNFAIFIVAFLVIGMMLGPNVNQVYTGTSITGSDTAELTNNGNLDTKVRDFSLSSVPGVPATGGTITRDGDYYVHTFTSNGTFTPSVSIDVEYLIVGGGGSGGMSAYGGNAGAGGGGSGGVLTNVDGTALNVVNPTSVVVGAAGLSQTTADSAGNSGSDSSFGLLVSVGGGGGGARTSSLNGLVGGSGGGGAYGGIVGPGTADQGYDGGTSATNAGAGGGGGAGGEGGDTPDATHGGPGGLGVSSLITGSTVWYAGGGGGGLYLHPGNAGIGGSGIGGDGGDNDGAGSPGITNTGSGGGGGGTGASAGVSGAGAKGIVIVRYVLPNMDVVDPGIAVGDDRLYYDGTLSSTLIHSDGSAYIDSSDVSANLKGSLPIIKVDTTQNIKIDHDLQYSITYVPKNMDVSSPNLFNANEDLTVNTRLTDTSGNPVSNQPLEMRVRLFDSEGDRYLDEIVSSTSVVVPGKYIKSGKHYQLRISYEGYEFGGWSNEILADFDVGTEGFIITSSPDKAPEGVMAASFAAASNLVGMAVTGWLDIPIIGDIIKFIADLIGVTL